ncbi:MAG: SDR family NAD(P)-dependent oxidoreductase, partial [Xanthomonadales bacterium]|nr:SDR family NAD(P)-dependent oxidoreductase [Xanthomonadales bacterium]
MELDLSGKRALVCGASEGIGRATAHELALLGAEVTVLARRRDALEDVLRALPMSNGQKHGLIVADAADTVGLGEKASELAARGPVHILVNNTGGPPGGRAIDADAGAFLDAFTKHLLANQTLAQ